VPSIQLLESKVRQSGLRISVGQLVGMMLVAAALGLAVSAILHLGLNGAFIFALLFGALPYLFVEKKRGARLKRFDEQLPDVLDVISRAMLSGYSLAGALKVVGEELPEPAGIEFQQTHDEISFGINPRDALAHLTDRVPSGDLRYVVIAILIQRETGGNLSEIFDKIASLMRERQQLAGQIRVLSADGRMSAVVLSLLPFVMMGVLAVINLRYVELLWTTAEGRQMLMVGGAMLLLGVAWIRNVVRIRF
jgi:tight adherence protein B